MRRVVAALAALGLAVGVAGFAQSQTEPAVAHVSVRAGEGLWQVAARLCPDNPGPQYNALWRANPWTSSVSLQPGTVLHVPEATCSPRPTTTTSTTTLPKADEFPTPETTGARVKPTQTVGALATSSDGQVIENVIITGQLNIRHDNVTVRDVIVRNGSYYMIIVNPKANGECPTGVLIEHVEIDGTDAAADRTPIGGSSCGYTFDRGYVHDVGRGVGMINDVTVTNSYIHPNRTWEGAHRNALISNGGEHLTIVGNTLICEGPNCSSALSLYGDFRQITDVLVEGNLFATSGGYCVYAGSEPYKPHPNGTDVRFIDNHFSTSLNEHCGAFGPMIGYPGDGVRGNVRIGNVWHETGLPVWG